MMSLIGKRLPAQPETHKIIRAQVIETAPDVYGVRFFFDDGTSDFADVGPKETADFYARVQLWERLPIGINPLLLNASNAEKLRRPQDEH
jgi:hypothetical protein